MIAAIQTALASLIIIGSTIATASYVNRRPVNGGDPLGNTLSEGQIFVGDANDEAQAVDVTGDIAIDADGVTSISSGVIVNADVASAAAIALSKLAALGGNSIPFTDASGFIISDSTNVTINNATDGEEQIRIGTVRTGGLPTAPINLATWGHQATYPSFQFGMAQTSVGETFINGAAGQLIWFTIGINVNNPPLILSATTALLGSNVALQLRGTNQNNLLSLMAPSGLGSSYTLTLPGAVSSADDVMTFNASGTASFGKVTASNLNVATFTAQSLGSAGAPSYTFTGDTNTGLFSATDIVGITTGGVEGFRVTATGATQNSRGRIFQRATGSGTIAPTNASHYIGANTSGAAVTVNLPAASTMASGQVLIINDESQNAAANNITINRAGSDTIDGATSLVIATNSGSARLITNGSNAWFTW